MVDSAYQPFTTGTPCISFPLVFEEVPSHALNLTSASWIRHPSRAPGIYISGYTEPSFSASLNAVSTTEKCHLEFRPSPESPSSLLSAMLFTLGVSA